MAFLLLVSAAAPVRGDIYKCTLKKTMTTYQNFPCEFDSLGAVSAERTIGAPAVLEQVPGHPRPGASAPRVGMSAREVRAIWGEPIETTREEFVKGDVETWRYADSRSIRFDPKGRVQQIHW